MHGKEKRHRFEKTRRFLLMGEKKKKKRGGAPSFPQHALEPEGGKAEPNEQ